ncbi:MAG: AAA family ATPase [Thermodesulfovibrionales bacterium]
MGNEIAPKWAREIVRFLPITPQFMLWGNIYDVYPVEFGGGVMTLRLIDYLKKLFGDNGYSLILKYEPLYGLTLIEGDPDVYKQITGDSIKKETPAAYTVNKCAETIEKLLASDKAYCAIILDFASRLPDIARNDKEEFYFRMFRLSQATFPKIVGESKFPKYHLVTWIIDKENDIPAWYTIDNPKIKNLVIPKPDYSLRKTVIENLTRNLSGSSELDEAKRQETVSMFVDQTNDLHASEIISIVTLARRENIPFASIGEAIRMYKLGIIENPWAKLDVEKVACADKILEKRVKGQNHAIRKSSDIIKRAVFNLAGAQYSKFSQRPKGVLFFAGPTGVGKTELAKSITELLFGSETSYIRFDMSEFAHEHSDQRLVGAPPGYVGYDVGGQLTNAIKQNPFSVVLFDEIEKSHPKILDIFLQILDDGRLTSGRGETAYFSESLIVFTSNLGIYELTPDGKKLQKVSPEMQYEDISENILQSIEDFFKFKIGRPEILNRIGDNIVVFDFIRPDVAYRIFDRMMKNILYKLTDSYNIVIEISSEAEKKLIEICCTDLSMGGRGIGNKLEDAFINPLSRTLFSCQAKAGETLFISDISRNGVAWELTAKKKST